jgi:predicted RNA-binding protein YlxR (DUF448 family)
MQTVERENEDVAQGGEKNSPKRRCIATKQIFYKDELIRFVVSPDGFVVADLDNKLPGRGMWVRVGRKYVEEAIKKGVFSKAAKRKVKVEEDLPQKLEAFMRARCLQLLGLAKKAGLLTSGFEKVRIALQNKKSGLLFAASDGSQDGRGKIKSISGNIPIIDLFTSNEISEVLGRVNSVHVYVQKGKMAKNLLKRTKILEDYISN